MQSQAIRLETERIQKLNLFEVSFSVTGDEWALPNDKQIILYRICQELLHNVIKYANPKQVMISLIFEKECLLISIEDDGKGFIVDDPARLISAIGGVGLINVENRAKLLGGNFWIDSKPGKGTKCYISVPITVQET